MSDGPNAIEKGGVLPSAGSFVHVQPGDTVYREFFGTIQPMVVDHVDDELIYIGEDANAGATFDRRTGWEEVDLLSMGWRHGVTCSRLVKLGSLRVVHVDWNRIGLATEFTLPHWPEGITIGEYVVLPGDSFPDQLAVVEPSLTHAATLRIICEVPDALDDPDPEGRAAWLAARMHAKCHARWAKLTDQQRRGTTFHPPEAHLRAARAELGITDD